MHEELWCPEGYEARDVRPAGPSSALCGCGAACFHPPGGEGRLPCRIRQPADDAPRAPVLAAWPEPGPRAILSTPPHEPASDEEMFEKGPEDHQDPTPPERHSTQVHPPGTEVIAPDEPEEPEPDLLDWVSGP